MSLFTPRHDIRRLSFARNNSHLQSNPLPSPYTPFSGRRSGALPPGTPQLFDPSRDDNLPPEPLEEAQRYIDGECDSFLRGSSIDAITASRKLSSFREPVDTALGYVSQIIAMLETQLEVSQALMQAPTQRPHIRASLQIRNSQLRLERDTWFLLQTSWRSAEVQSEDLCTRRLQPSPLDETNIQEVDGYVKLQRIVEWLERIADDTLASAGGPLLKPLDDPAYRWAYTAANHYTRMPVSMDHPCKGRPLDEVERKAELRLSRELYRLIRAGRLEEAEEVCRGVGQPWRAAVLAGGKRGFSLASNGVKGEARRTWKKAAAAIARSTNNAVTPHERAVCGVLAGVLEPVLAVAECYEDEVWARMSVLLDGTAEKILMSGTNDAKVSDESILEAFQECQSPGRATETVAASLLECMRKVQSYLSLGPRICSEHLTELLKVLSQLSQNGLEQNAEWASRFAAQACTFLKFSGLMSEGDRSLGMYDDFDTAVQSFVQLVIKKDIELESNAAKRGNILPARPLVSSTAAHFLAEVSAGQRTVDTYVDLLGAALREDLKHERMERARAGVESREIEERRILCLKKAGQCFTRDTLQAMVIAAVDFVWKNSLALTHSQNASGTNVSTDHTLDAVTDDDECVVRAIEFLLYPDYAEYDEALVRVTKAARFFFLIGKRQATKRLIQWFPRQALEQVEVETQAAALHEYDCWDAYLNAVKKHGDWNTYFSSKRPAPLLAEIRNLALAEPGTVSYEDQASAKLKLQNYQAEMDQYNGTCLKYRDAAIDGLRSALLFSGGWMRDIADCGEGDDMNDHDDDDRHRRREISAVRSFGIPQLAMLLHHVFHESELYSDAVELAVVIAHENLRLYESFGKPEMKAFLARIADSAILLADSQVMEHEISRPYEGAFFEEFKQS